MRWDAGTLRVICLVASATSAGYLWRAALEGDNELQRLLDTSPPAIVEDKSDPPTRSSPSLAGLAPDRLVPTGTAPDRPVEPKARPAARAKRAGAAKAARPTAGEAQRPSSRPGRTTPEPTGGSAAPPRPPRTPPTPAPGSSGPKAPPGEPSAPPPPKPEPKPTPPPAAPAPAPEPAATPSPPPPVVEPPAEPSVSTPLEQRPGWGGGDKNHEHTGPPGKGRK